MSAAHVLFGSFGARGTAVGTPVIGAARLCVEKESFKKAQRSIIVDNEFQRRSGLGAFEEMDHEFLPKGIGRKIRIFRANNP